MDGLEVNAQIIHGCNFSRTELHGWQLPCITDLSYVSFLNREGSGESEQE